MFWPVLTELKLNNNNNNKNKNIWILCLICLTSLLLQKRDLNPLSWIYHFLPPLRTGLASSVLTRPGRYSEPTVTLNVSIHTAFQNRQDNINVWHFYHCHKLSFQPCFQDSRCWLYGLKGSANKSVWYQCCLRKLSFVDQIELHLLICEDQIKMLSLKLQHSELSICYD